MAWDGIINLYCLFFSPSTGKLLYGLELFIVTTISHVENMKCENADK